MDLKCKDMINLLTSKIFHDLGNVSVVLGLFISLNKENPSKIDFDELIEINKRMSVTLAVLKYAFLPGEHDENTFIYLKEYFLVRKMEIVFEIDDFLFSQDDLTVTVHTLMLLSKIVTVGAKILIHQDDKKNLFFKCKANEEVDKNKLTIFSFNNVADNINLTLLKDLLVKLNLQCSYSFLSDKEFVIKYSSIL